MTDAPAWEIPKYDLERLKQRARLLLQESGADPRDSLAVYRLVNKLRGDELKKRLPVIEGQVLVPAERRLPAVPEAHAVYDSTKE